jgi:3-oxoacyl-[acyl-carrier-protein] synthase II
MGTVNAIGQGVQETWQNALAGVSGVGPITLFDTETWQHEWNVKIACEVKNFDPTRYMDGKEARRRDRFEQLGIAAAKEALEMSGLQVTSENAERIGVAVSSAIGGLKSLQDAIFTLKEEGARKVSPFLIPDADAQWRVRHDWNRVWLSRAVHLGRFGLRFRRGWRWHGHDDAALWYG